MSQHYARIVGRTVRLDKVSFVGSLFKAMTKDEWGFKMIIDGCEITIFHADVLTLEQAHRELLKKLTSGE